MLILALVFNVATSRSAAELQAPPYFMSRTIKHNEARGVIHSGARGLAGPDSVYGASEAMFPGRKPSGTRDASPNSQEILK
ncbi:hypothetical protein DPMN_036941 [Dreissena polymorpha]|uniref:Uncharacterized protein n=1 Tax=Dreissena polymorpha TaxID=45954 RepID=A0A9D4RMC4_DREPO|nr:hypothetical protein DPMN_036941 [Dreissena polymorpha]